MFFSLLPKTANNHRDKTCLTYRNLIFKKAALFMIKMQCTLSFCLLSSVPWIGLQFQTQQTRSCAFKDTTMEKHKFGLLFQWADSEPFLDQISQKRLVGLFGNWAPGRQLQCTFPPNSGPLIKKPFPVLDKTVAEIFLHACGLKWKTRTSFTFPMQQVHGLCAFSERCFFSATQVTTESDSRGINAQRKGNRPVCLEYKCRPLLLRHTTCSLPFAAAGLSVWNTQHHYKHARPPSEETVYPAQFELAFPGQGHTPYVVTKAESVWQNQGPRDNHWKEQL